MRTQRNDVGALEITGDAHFSLAEGGGIADAHEHDFGNAKPRTPDPTGRQCSEMPSGFCCGLSPKRIRLDTGAEKCACGGPGDSEKFSTQTDIDRYCSQVVQPCDQISHVTCCDSAPKMIRHHDGKGQCWCSGPQNDSAYSTQASIDDWCSAVIRPCPTLSEGHCCHMQPKQTRQGSGEKCWCSGPLKGGPYATQQLIDTACSEVVKPCSLVPRGRCCSMSPKQIRYNDGNDQCWCSGPVVGEAFSSQLTIDEWCNRAFPTTTTSTTTTTTTTTTLWMSNLTCEEVSEAACCAMSPKRWRAGYGNGRCYCANASVADSPFKSQQAIDAHCALLVRPCHQMRQEDCCMRSPNKYLVGDDNGTEIGVGESKTKMCTCTGPLKATRFTEQQAIDEACSQLWTPCSPLQKAQCCLNIPARMQEGRGKKCFCSGPSSAGAYKTQKDVEAACNKIIQPCDVLNVSACCSKMPAEVRVRDRDKCWCSTPFSYGNLTYSQQKIDFLCSSADPPSVDVDRT